MQANTTEKAIFRHNLFDLDNDPDEITNLAAEERDTLQKMRSMLQDWLRKMQISGIGNPRLEMNQEEINKLKSLGYL